MGNTERRLRLFVDSIADSQALDGLLRQGVGALRIKDSTYGGPDFVMVLNYDMRPVAGGRSPGWEFDVEFVNFWPASTILPSGLP